MQRTLGGQVASAARILATLLALLVLGGGALGIAALAWLRTRFGDGDDAALAVQRWVHRGARVFLGVSRALGLLRVSGDLGPALAAPGGRLLVANHPTAADAMVLIAAAPQLDCIVKQSWATHPVIGRAARAAGYVIAEDGAPAVAETARRILAGRRVLVFPEGTRSPVGGLGPFQRGAAHIALAAGCDILPVVLRSHPPDALKKGWRWWDQPAGGTTIDVEVGDPIPPKASLTGDETHSVAVRRVTATLRTFYGERLGVGE